jgi:hypothetical protein
MSDLATILSITDSDARDAELYALMGIVGPGAYALREPDGRLMVWASEEDSVDDDGARATYRSRGTITDAEWDAITRLAWIDDYEA